MRKRFPEWIRRPWASGEDFSFTKALIEDLDLHTVCQSANCPNIGECWARRTATIMVLGHTCTRSCRYCSVPAGKPETVDPNEPGRVAEAVRRMRLKHAVITSVTRDDLPDGGAGHIANVIRAMNAASPATTVEVLVPDFKGCRSDIETVLAAGPDVFSHNIETVQRLHPILRSSRFNYHLTLDVLRSAAALSDSAMIKSALMVGHGEALNEVRATLRDLLDAGCTAMSMGQYLQPTQKQRDVMEFVHPDQFKAYEVMAYALGFECVVAGPFVRSSYRSDEMMEKHLARQSAAEARRA